MAAQLTPEQEWTLVACGLVAHADNLLELGEWDQILGLIDASVEDEGLEPWLELLGSRPELERRFAELPPPLPFVAEEILEQAWRIALADGAGSEVEVAVHDRVAERAGIEAERVAELRARWTAEAVQRAELVVAFAAALANLDGRMDSAEAAQFDSLLERTPLSVSRRLELSGLLYEPQPLEALGEELRALPEGLREGVLRELAPLVKASHRGEREREAYLELARQAAIPDARALALLGG